MTERPDTREQRLLELIGVLEPNAIERARRVELAIKLLDEGQPVRAVRAEIRRRFRIAQPLAWRVVDMAVDMAGPA